MLYECGLSGLTGEIGATITARSEPNTQPAVGAIVYLNFRKEDVHVFKLS
jgi:hypothetical protein